MFYCPTEIIFIKALSPACPPMHASQHKYSESHLQVAPSLIQTRIAIDRLSYTNDIHLTVAQQNTLHKHTSRLLPKSTQNPHTIDKMSSPMFEQCPTCLQAIEDCDCFVKKAHKGVIAYCCIYYAVMSSLAMVLSNAPITIPYSNNYAKCK